MSQESRRIGAEPSARQPSRPNAAAALSLSAFLALNAAVPASAQTVQSQTAVAVDTAPAVSARDVSAHVAALDDLLAQSESTWDGLEAFLGRFLGREAQAPELGDPAPEDDAALTAAPLASARISLDMPATRVAYAHTVTDGWTGLNENFGSTVYAADVASDDEGGPRLALFVASLEDSLLTSPPASEGATLFKTEQCEELPLSLRHAASEQGFDGGLLYRLAPGHSSLAATAEARPVTLAASLERTDGSGPVRPGDVVTFRLALASSFDAAELNSGFSAQLTSADVGLEVNGAPVAPEALRPTATPGTFELRHRVSDADVAAQAVRASLEVRASYEGRLATDADELVSHAVVGTSLDAEAPLAMCHGVTYRYLWNLPPDNDDAHVPENITPPRDPSEHWEGQQVALLEPSASVIPMREGTWSFSGWRVNGEPAGDVAPMGEDGLVLDGVWDFTAAPRRTVSYSFSGQGPVLDAPSTAACYAGDNVALPMLGPVADTRPNAAGEPKDGQWVFTGWRVDGEPAATVTVADEDIAVTGTWQWVVASRPSPVSLVGYRGVYDGQDHGVTLAGLLNGDEPTYTAVRESAGLWPARPRQSVDAPVRTDAGATAVSVTVKNRGFADDAQAEARLEVLPRPVRVSAADATWVLGQPEPVYRGAIEMAPWGAPSDRGLLDRTHLGSVSFVRASGTDAPGVHEGAIVARYVENPNYEVEVVPGTLTVEEPREV